VADARLAAADHVQQGDRLSGRYRLEERLAWGGMGEVWRAHDEHIERDVAIKVLREDLANDPGATERFRREARTAASFTHPNVASVYDVVNGGTPGIVMELVRGETLANAVRRGPLSTEEAVHVADGLLAALEAAHAAGIVHRDVTPGNVLLSDEGRVKVTDFGIARTAHDTVTRLTDTGTVIGTAHYLAPEQLEGGDPTPGTDQYAAALVIYEALTGTLPFEGSTPAAAAIARIQVAPTPLRERLPEVNPAIADVVMRALARDPAERFPSVGEMRQELRRAHEAPTPPGVGAGVATAASAAVTEIAGIPVSSGETAQMPMPTPAPSVSPQAPTHRRNPRPWARRGGLFLVLVILSVLVSGLVVAKITDAPSLVEVPTLTGMSIDDATTAAEERGLRVESTETDGAAPKGTVLNQTLPPGARVESNSLVALDVSTGVPPCCTVPDLRGASDADAIAATITDAGLVVGRADPVESDEPAGVVVDQSPPPGTTVERGTAVDVRFSLGPPEEDDDRPGKGRDKGDD